MNAEPNKTDTLSTTHSEARAPSCLRVATTMGLVWLATLIGLLILAFAITQREWVATQATVESTRIESVRPGTPAWGLMADFHYTVNGQRNHHSGERLFHRTEYEQTKREQASWPTGKRFTVYYDAKNPDKWSLYAKGGTEVTYVLAVVFSPFATIVLGLPFLFRLGRQSKR